MKKTNYRNLINLVIVISIMVASAIGASVVSGSTTVASGTSGVSGRLTLDQMIAKIDAKYNLNPWLGNPISDYINTRMYRSDMAFYVYRYYAGGAICVGYDQSKASIIRGLILSKWTGDLGGYPYQYNGDAYPTGDDMSTADGAGIFQRFIGNGGTEIYYTQSTGVHTISGDFLKKWTELGKEKSVLGYPRSDEFFSSASNEMWMQFQHGILAQKSDGTFYIKKY